jgi:hypothetical protein
MLSTYDYLTSVISTPILRTSCVIVYLSISGPTTAVAVFRNPNTIPCCVIVKTKKITSKNSEMPRHVFES